MEQPTIVIRENDEDMLSMDYNGKNLFYGNVWDFHTNASTFKELFEKLGFKVEVRELKE